MSNQLIAGAVLICMAIACIIFALAARKVSSKTRAGVAAAGTVLSFLGVILILAFLAYLAYVSHH